MSAPNFRVQAGSSSLQREHETVLSFYRTLSVRIAMLTQDQLDFYHENGYVLAKGLLRPDEAAEYRRECHDLAERLSKHQNMDATWGSAREAVEEAKDTKVLH